MLGSDGRRFSLVHINDNRIGIIAQSCRSEEFGDARIVQVAVVNAVQTFNVLVAIRFDELPVKRDGILGRLVETVMVHLVNHFRDSGCIPHDLYMVERMNEA